jgi:hypothetical protein
LEPAVRTIGTPLAELKSVRLPCFDRVPSRVDHTRKIIRVDSFVRGPMLQLLNRLAEIFQDLTVEEFHLAGGTQGTYKPRNGVDDQTKTLLQRRLAGRGLREGWGY